jgi:hypothetical protein
MLATSVPAPGVSPGSGSVSLFVGGAFSTGFSAACTGLVGAGACSAFALGFTASALEGLGGAGAGASAAGVGSGGRVTASGATRRAVVGRGAATSSTAYTGGPITGFGITTKKISTAAT